MKYLDLGVFIMKNCNQLNALLNACKKNWDNLMPYLMPVKKLKNKHNALLNGPPQKIAQPNAPINDCQKKI